MNELTFSFKHNLPFDEANRHLATAVGEVGTRFGPLIQKVDWSGERDAVKITGRGFDVDMRVDSQTLHVRGNLPFLGGFLSSPMAAGLKGIVQNAFTKRLT